MGKFINLTGQRFGRLRIMNRAPNRGTKTFWNCTCECNNVREIWSYNLIGGHTTSCGCKHKELVAAGTRRTHGKNNTKNHKLWTAIKQRCYNKDHPQYGYYGGSGIKVHVAWLNDFEVFEAYIEAIVPKKKPGESLDRIENDKGYEPGNLKWSTAKEQSGNTRPRLNVKQWELEDFCSFTGADLDKVRKWQRKNRT